MYAETSSENHRPHDPANGFPVAPEDADFIIYCRSGGLASDTRPKADEQGDDIAGLGTKASPVAGPVGVQRLVGRYLEQGARVWVRLAGGLTDEEKAAGVDPWVNPSSMRQYPVRSLFIGGTEAYVNSVFWDGPENLVAYAVQPTIVNLEPDPSTNGRTRWRISNASAFAANELNGRYLQVRRNGLLVSFEMQITGLTLDGGVGPNGYIYTDNGNYTNGGGTFSTATDTFRCVSRAAEFIPTSRPGTVDGGVGGADGIALHGFGASNPFGRLTNGLNPRPTFRWVGFENLNCRGARGVYFDRCAFYHSLNFMDSSLSFRGCVVDSQVTSTFRNCYVNIEDTPLATEAQEYNGYATVEGGPSNALGNPIHPDVGGQGLYFFSASGSAGGLQLFGGQFNTRKGLSVEGGIIVHNAGRLVMPAPGSAHSVHVRNCTGVGTAAVRLRGDSVFMLEKNNLSFVNVTNHLKLESGAAIDLGTGAGQFSEAAGWNGNFCRRLEVNGAGKPTGDNSAVRDTAIYE